MSVACTHEKAKKILAEGGELPELTIGHFRDDKFLRCPECYEGVWKKELMIPTNNNEGVYVCGYCKKETPLDDEELYKYIDVENLELKPKSPCSCEHFSYVSSIRCKAVVRAKDWRIHTRYGIFNNE